MTNVSKWGAMLAIALTAAWATVAQAAEPGMSMSASAPAVDNADIAQLAGGSAVNGDLTAVWSNQPRQGQSFTTGSNAKGYILSAVTVKHNFGNTWWTATGPWEIRIGTMDGGNNFSVIATETMTGLNISGNNQIYLTWTLATPVALNPNTVYAFDLGVGTAGFGIVTENSPGDTYAYGSAFSGARSMDPPANPQTLRSFDRVFHVDLTTPPSEEPEPPAAPFMPGPTNGAVNVALTSSLTWSCSDATGYTVALWPDNGATTTASVVLAAWTPGMLAASSGYNWQVVATNSVGSSTGAVWTFTTIVPPSTPSVLTPANGAANVPVTTNLAWSSSLAEGYTVSLWPDGGVTTTVTVASATWTPGPLAYSTTYSWQVVATNTAGSSTGVVWTFTTTVPPPPTTLLNIDFLDFAPLDVVGPLTGGTYWNGEVTQRSYSGMLYADGVTPATGISVTINGGVRRPNGETGIGSLTGTGYYYAYTTDPDPLITVVIGGLKPGKAYDVVLFNGAGAASTYTLGTSEFAAASGVSSGTFVQEVNYVKFRAPVVGSGGQITVNITDDPRAIWHTVAGMQLQVVPSSTGTLISFY